MTTEKTILGIALCLAAFGLGGCGPDFERIEFSGVKESDLGGNISVTKLEVPEGLIVKSHIVAWNDDHEAMNLQVRVVDPAIVEVSGVITDRDFAFIGRKIGRTRLEFKAEDTVVLTIEAEVTAQPTLP